MLCEIKRKETILLPTLDVLTQSGRTDSLDAQIIHLTRLYIMYGASQVYFHIRVEGD